MVGFLIGYSLIGVADGEPMAAGGDWETWSGAADETADETASSHGGSEEGCTKDQPCPLLFVPGFGSMRLYPNQYNMETYNECGAHYPPVWVKQRGTYCTGAMDQNHRGTFENVKECKDLCAKEGSDCKGVQYSTYGTCWLFQDEQGPNNCDEASGFDAYFFHPKNGEFSEKNALFPDYVGNQWSNIPWNMLKGDADDTEIAKKQTMKKRHCFYLLLRLEERDDEGATLVANPGGSWNEALTDAAKGHPAVTRGLVKTLKTRVYTTGEFEDQAHMMVYDWRRAPDELQARSKFCHSMKDHVERLFRNTGKRVVLMGHSYGGLLIFSCTQLITRHPEMGGPDWIRQHVEAYAPANSPLLGAINAITKVFSKFKRKLGKTIGGWSSLFMKRTYRSLAHFYPKGGDMLWGPEPIVIVDESQGVEKYGATAWCKSDELRLGPKDLTKTLCSAPRGPGREKDGESPGIYDVLNLKLPPFPRVMLFGDSGIDTTSTVHLVQLEKPITSRDGEEARYYEKTVDTTPSLAMSKPVHEKSKLGDGTVPLLSQIYPAWLWKKELYAYPGKHKTEIHFKIQKESTVTHAHVFDLNVELLVDVARLLTGMPIENQDELLSSEEKDLFDSIDARVDAYFDKGSSVSEESSDTYA